MGWDGIYEPLFYVLQFYGTNGFTYENDGRKVDSNRCGEEQSLTDPIQEHKDALSLDQEVEHHRMHI